MPKPNQTPCAEWRRALSLRAAFAPTSSAERRLRLQELVWGSSGIVKRRHAADEIAFHFRQCRAHILLLLVQGQKLALHRLAQLAEVRSGNGVRRRK